VWKSIGGYLIADNLLNQWVLCFFVPIHLPANKSLLFLLSYFLGFRGELKTKCTSKNEHQPPTPNGTNLSENSKIVVGHVKLVI
jgi:hypothetical protein